MIEQISLIVSSNPRPTLASSEGLVVTPSTQPIAWAARISLTVGVSMKNFMVLSERCFNRGSNRAADPGQGCWISPEWHLACCRCKSRDSDRLMQVAMRMMRKVARLQIVKTGAKPRAAAAGARAQRVSGRNAEKLLNYARRVMEAEAGAICAGCTRRGPPLIYAVNLV